ncbi:hypothetical protein [Georgenia faecalis]|uniref:hypothetical protein n=1 Tax=Georgenia faecalis TaxID=2483799 RepID=UPI000FDB1AE0|nr:hypothetical protein [Georgenia faecalis]
MTERQNEPHADAPATDDLGRATTGPVARARFIVALVGNTVGALALLVGAGTVFWLLSLTGGGEPIRSVVEDDTTGTETMSFPILMALLSMIAFFFGQFAARGRWGADEGYHSSGGSFTVLLRPVSVGLHAVLLVVALAAWALVMVVPLVLEAQGAIAASDGSTALSQYWTVVTVYSVVTGALAGMTGVSLLKKLTYNESLRRHGWTIRKGTPSQLRWRLVSHIWRAELGIAAVAGVALGLAPLGVHLESTVFSVSFAAAGAALLAGAVVMALNAWRSGLPVERVESYT